MIFLSFYTTLYEVGYVAFEVTKRDMKGERGANKDHLNVWGTSKIVVIADLGLK